KQRQKNRRLTPIRAKVERPFAVLKRCYGWVRVRYVGLARNAAHLWQLRTAFNLQLVALRA
ncbi:IS5/IS1182 family transposase, partial [Patescibacteria group bacterium]